MIKETNFSYLKRKLLFAVNEIKTTQKLARSKL